MPGTRVPGTKIPLSTLRRQRKEPSAKDVKKPASRASATSNCVSPPRSTWHSAASVYTALNAPWITSTSLGRVGMRAGTILILR